MAEPEAAPTLPPVAQVELNVIVHAEKDDVPTVDCDELVLYRASKPPAYFTSASSGVSLVVKHGDKGASYQVKGFAKSLAVMTIHDGSHDSFDSMPPSVKKRFKSSMAIKELFEFDLSGKLYALILQGYLTKGQYRYDVGSPKIRSGFGKALVQRVKPQGHSQRDAANYFKVAQQPPASASGVVKEGDAPKILPEVGAEATESSKTDPSTVEVPKPVEPPLGVSDVSDGE